jgi:hypothetical protein
MFPNGTSQIWTKYGTVLTGHPTNDENTLSEPNVIYEANAQVLSGTVYKMWVRGGWTNARLNYYESTDGISWTAHSSNPLITGTFFPYVFKDGSTYYLYYAPQSPGRTRFDMRTSADGITWSAATTSVLSVGAGGQWDDTEFGNVNVWKESANDWRILYDARTGSGPWHEGYATSSDGTTWSKSGSNPVINETGTTGGLFRYKAADNTYWVWGQRSASGILPTDISRWRSTNLTSWTRDPANSTLTRTSTDGNGGFVGQLADPCMLTVDSQTYAWMAASADGSDNTEMHIALFIARLPLAQLVNTSEGY